MALKRFLSLCCISRDMLTPSTLNTQTTVSKSTVKPNYNCIHISDYTVACTSTALDHFHLMMHFPPEGSNISEAPLFVWQLHKLDDSTTSGLYCISPNLCSVWLWEILNWHQTGIFEQCDCVSFQNNHLCIEFDTPKPTPPCECCCGLTWPYLRSLR